MPTNSPNHSPRPCGAATRLLSRDTESTPQAAAFTNRVNFSALVRHPRHKWFGAVFREDERWHGPYDNIEEAARAAVCEYGERVCYVGQGRRLTKAEADENGYDWEVDTRNALRIELPNA